MSIANFSTASQELIVQPVDLAGLTARDIPLMQGSQLMLGWLVVVIILNRPWSLVKWRGTLSISCKRRVSANRDSRHRQHRANENGTS
jgi:hypothetical protein